MSSHENIDSIFEQLVAPLAETSEPSVVTVQADSTLVIDIPEVLAVVLAASTDAIDEALHIEDSSDRLLLRRNLHDDPDRQPLVEYPEAGLDRATTARALFGGAFTIEEADRVLCALASVAASFHARCNDATGEEAEAFAEMRGLCQALSSEILEAVERAEG